MTHVLLATLLALGATITDEPFGAIPNDGKDDTAAIQAAIDSLPNGGTVIIPPGTFHVSHATGVTIKPPRIRMIIRGDLAVTTDGKESHESNNLFTITGAYCTIVGEGGMVYGPPGKVYTGGKCLNTHRVIRYPKFFYATTPANHCVIENLHMRDPPGGLVAFVGINDCRMSDCTIEGGVRQDIELKEQPGPYSRYLGVMILATKGAIIRGNQFSYYEGRGMFSWITGSGSNRHTHTVIADNTFEGGYDHAIYISGLQNSVVANNTSRDSVGLALKIIGDDNVVIGNHITNSRGGGISTRNGSRNVIAHNVINGFGHRAISITPYGGGNREPYTDNIVQGNIIIGQTKDPNHPVMSAIRIQSHDHVSRCKVLDNIIHNTGTGNSALDSKLPGEPAIFVGGPNPSSQVTITGNTIFNARGDGIEVHHLRGEIIDQNQYQGAGQAVVRRNNKDAP